MPSKPGQRTEASLCVKMTRGRWPHWHWKCRKAGIVEEIEQTRGPCKILSPGGVLCPRNRSRLWPKKSKTMMKMSLAKLAQWYCFSFFLTCFCRSLRYFVWFEGLGKLLLFSFEVPSYPFLLTPASTSECWHALGVHHHAYLRSVGMEPRTWCMPARHSAS